jgi:hypothetical protein
VPWLLNMCLDALQDEGLALDSRSLIYLCAILINDILQLATKDCYIQDLTRQNNLSREKLTLDVITGTSAEVSQPTKLWLDYFSIGWREEMLHTREPLSSGYSRR